MMGANIGGRCPRAGKIGLLIVLVVALVVAIFYSVRAVVEPPMNSVTGYFDSANGIYVGDEVRILGVKVGKVTEIDAQPNRVKIVFEYDADHKVPANANVVIISPSLVSSRALQLTPAYTGGPAMADNAVIPQDRTAVPVEWDDFRQQIEKLNTTLGPDAKGQTGLGDFLDTASANLEGQGPSINDALGKLSQASAVLGDKSTDIFSTIKNLQVFVSALVTSSALLARVNTNLADVMGYLTNQPDEINKALVGLDGAVADVGKFLTDNRQRLVNSTAKVTEVSSTLVQSRDDLEQTLHLAPTAFQNFVNIFQPAQSAFTGILAYNNFSNPVSFICGAIQAASKKGAEESAKLCVQYLGPVLKNLAVNFPALGANPITGATVRPNEITYSEDRLKGAIPATGPGPLSQSTPTAAAPRAPAAKTPAASTAPDNRNELLMPGMSNPLPGAPK